MAKLTRHRFLPLLAAILIAVFSVFSAAQMGPSERNDPALTAVLALGGTLDDLCADLGPGHDHDCPFCRLLSDPPANDPASQSRRLVVAFVDDAAVGLLVGHQSGNPRASPRAPPILA